MYKFKTHLRELPARTSAFCI